MPLRDVQKATAYLIAGLGLALIAFSGELGTAGIVLVAAAYIASWWMEEPRITSKRWHQAWNTLTVSVFIIQFIRWWLGLSFVTAAVQFAAFLQINKLFNRRTQSDYDHILVLSLLHLIGSSILFSDIEYALLFIFYIIITPWHMMLGQIRREVEAKYLEKKDAEAIYNFRRVLKSKRLISGKLLAGTALLSIPICIFTTVFFLFFPRVGLGLLAGQAKLGRQSVGFSDTISLGDLVPLMDNPLAVARVKLQDPKPPRESLMGIHWRATAYDRYDGTQWLRTLPFEGSLRLHGNSYILSDNPYPDLVRAKQQGWTISFVLQPLNPKVLLIPQRSVMVEVPQRQPLRGIHKKLSWGPSSEIRYSDPFDAGISYEVVVEKGFDAPLPIPPFGLTSKAPTPQTLAKYLQLPALSDRFLELAGRFSSTYQDPMERALAIQKWLSTTFRYTRDKYKKVPKGMSPVDAFLFRWKEGNCEYYSTAMVLLLRAGGIPARNVAGFLGGQWNSIGDYLIIREGDAHSWVEAYIEGRGWLIFDPTPASAPPLVSPHPLITTFFHVFDIISLSWQKHVIAYDLSRQSKYMRLGYEKIMRARRSLSGLPGRIDYSFGLPQKRILLLLAVLGLWLVYFFSMRKKETIAIQQSYKQTVSIRKAMNLMAELDKKLDSMGLPRPPSSPPLAHSLKISPMLANPPAVIEIVQAYNSTRFGGRFMDRSEYKALIQKIKALA